MSKKTCGSRPSFCASTNASQVADHGRAEDHVVADLGRLAGARAAGVDHGLAHLLEDRLGPGEASSVPPTMKVRVPASAAAMPPDTGASTIV